VTADPNRTAGQQADAYAAAVRRAVENAPRLTDKQLARLRQLIGPGTSTTPDEGAA
jgi:hypothetical protein